MLTGATGYVGGRLLTRLAESNHQVRCMTRDPNRLAGRVPEGTQIVHGDVLDPASLPSALHGVHTAYYLIHSMGTSEGFQEDDRRGAILFAEAAKAAGVQRIIYLGGLGNGDEDLSPHLRSRQEVGRLLQRSGAQVIEFRASIIIGSGSLSFELVRSLVRKLPIMLWPRWVSTEASPIGIRDVLAYLTEVLAQPIAENRVYEIGGPTPVSYGGIMEEYARQRGLRRLTIRVPFLSPRISSLWLGLVTPVYARIGRKLVAGLTNPTVVRDPRARQDFDIQPADIQTAIARAIEREDREMIETRWSDALSATSPKHSWGGDTFGNRLLDSRTLEVDAPVDQTFAAVQRLGGREGWHYANWLWRIRGFLDLLVGGVGMRRGRRHPVELRTGDVIDFWRVESLDPGKRLRLQAEMKLPGRGWLEFEVRPITAQRSELRQTAEFDPLGLTGLLYWYSIWPLHQFVFDGMLRGIGRRAESLPASKPESTMDKSAMPRSPS